MLACSRKMRGPLPEAHESKGVCTAGGESTTAEVLCGLIVALAAVAGIPLILVLSAAISSRFTILLTCTRIP